MNEISLRTNANEYIAGATVYGAVYLQLLNPTIGCGVRLKFYGYERVHFGSDKDKDSASSVKKSKTYINNDDIILHKREGPFKCGFYIFPFKFKLPDDIPSTFNWEHKEKLWEAIINYELHAELIQAKVIHTSEKITVVDSAPHQNEEITVRHSLREYLRLVKREISLSARIDEEQPRSGKTCLLKLKISTGVDVTIDSICVKLIQTLLVLWHNAISRGSFNRPLSLMQPDPSDEVVRVMTLTSSTDDDELQLGTYDILVHLTRPTDVIPPSTSGLLVQCKYHIDVAVTLNHGDVVHMEVPLHKVLPPHDDVWKSWVPPSWASSASIIHANSPLDVPPHILYGEPFLLIPPFHPLNN